MSLFKGWELTDRNQRTRVLEMYCDSIGIRCLHLSMLVMSKGKKTFLVHLSEHFCSLGTLLRVFSTLKIAPYMFLFSNNRWEFSSIVTHLFLLIFEISEFLLYVDINLSLILFVSFYLLPNRILINIY